MKEYEIKGDGYFVDGVEVTGEEFARIWQEEGDSLGYRKYGRCIMVDRAVVDTHMNETFGLLEHK